MDELFNLVKKMLVSVFCIISVSAVWGLANGIDVEFEGFVINGQGLVGHGGTGTVPNIYNPNTQQWINNPYSQYYFNGEIYSKLSGSESFSKTTGVRNPGVYVPPFQATIPAGHNFDLIGITSNNNNYIHFGTTSLTLDYTSATDYYWNEAANTENRVYRGGTIRIYEETTTDVYEQILEYKDVVITVRIQWANILGGQNPQITIEGKGYPSKGSSNDLPLIDIISFNLESNAPINVDGYVSEPGYSGYYAYYENINGHAVLQDYLFDFQDLLEYCQCWLATDSLCLDRFDLDTDGRVRLGDLSTIANRWDYWGQTAVKDIEWVAINESGLGLRGEISKYEITNAQYCQYLNEALASGDIQIHTFYGFDFEVRGNNGSNAGEDFIDQPYYSLLANGSTVDGAVDGGKPRISYSAGEFVVEQGFENHPVTYVSWYGATAFCNYYSWQLPDYWQWNSVADYNGGYTYGCGTTIHNNKANYAGSYHPDGTTAVGSYGTFGYGVADMAGNAREWTSTEAHSARYYLKGGSWKNFATGCLISADTHLTRDSRDESTGFRPCR